MNKPSQSLFLVAGPESDARIKPIVCAIKKHKNLIVGKKVVDVGSNCGFFPQLYSKIGAASVLAIEPRKCFEDYFYRQNNLRIPKNMWWLVSDVTKTTIPKCDVLSCLGLIYHLSGGLAVLEKMMEQTGAKTLILDSQVWSKNGRRIETCKDNSNCFKLFDFVSSPSIDSINEWIKTHGLCCVFSMMLESKITRPRGFWIAKKITGKTYQDGVIESAGVAFKCFADDKTNGVFVSNKILSVLGRGRM